MELFFRLRYLLGSSCGDAPNRTPSNDRSVASGADARADARATGSCHGEYLADGEGIPYLPTRHKATSVGWAHDANGAAANVLTQTQARADRAARLNDIR